MTDDDMTPEQIDADDVEELIVTERVLGACLRQPVVAMKLVRAGITKEEFSRVEHGHMWEAITATMRNDSSTDAGTVEAHLVGKLSWKRADARRTVSDCEQSGFGSLTDDAVAGFIERIRLAAGTRRLRRVAIDILESTTKRRPITQIASTSVQAIEAIVSGTTSISTTKSGGQLLDERRARLALNLPVVRIPTGIADLDKLMRGGRRMATTTLIGADSTVGKTTIMAHMVIASIAAGRRPLVITIEATHEEVIDSLVEMRARVKWEDATTREEHTALAESAAWFASRAFFVDRAESITAEEIAAKMHKYKHDEGVDDVFIDYVQAVTHSTKHQRLDANFAHVSTTLKNAGLRNGQAMVWFSQRAAEDARAGKKKQPQEVFAETKQWFKDAHYAVLVSRDITSDDDTKRNTTIYEQLKNRPERGGVGRAWMLYDRMRLIPCDAHGRMMSEHVDRQVTINVEVDDAPPAWLD